MAGRRRPHMMSVERQTTEDRVAVLPGDPTIDFPFTLPYGYRPEKGVLEPDGARADLVQQIFKDAAEGHSLENIAERLNKDSNDPVLLPEGETTWTPAVVESVLRDRTYLGEWSGIGSVREIVDPGTFENAQRNLERRLAPAGHRGNA
jgi:hypothetical protein